MELDKELLKEFQKLGIEYPLITKMFMDLVSVESLALDAQSKEVIIKEHEWKLNILKENLMDSFKEGNDLPSTPFSSLGKKKTLLN